MLLLDVAGTYANVSLERFLYNIKQLRLGQFASWIASFLSGKGTRIKLRGHLSDSFPTPNGIHKARLAHQSCSYCSTRHQSPRAASEEGMSILMASDAWTM